MSTSNKLYNPTPFDREIDYDRGVVIKVPAEGSVSLTVEQMSDFQEGRAGSEEALQKLTSQGLFLLNTDREYDVQAFEAINQCIKYLEMRYNEAVNTLQTMHVAANMDANPESNAFKNKLKVMGLTRLQSEIVILRKRAGLYSDAIGPQTEATPVPKFDPERTCFVTNPPREFPTKLALKIFLEENPEIKAKQEVALGPKAEPFITKKTKLNE